MPVQDVEVTIDVQNPAPKIGLGRPLILVESNSTDSTYEEFRSIDSLKAKYSESTSAYKKAKAVFDQTNRPDLVAVATYNPNAGTIPEGGTEPSEGLTLTQAVDKYYNKPWHFMLLPDADTKGRLDVSNAVEGKKFKFLVLKVEDQAELSQYRANSRTLCYFHPNKQNEEIDAAIVGAAASLTVGSITWKFIKGLAGVTANDDIQDVDVIHAQGANCYVTKAGVPQTSEGITANGSYIDQIHGQDWVKSNAETGLFQLLSNNNKVPANHTGVVMAQSELTNTLTTAAINGIINKDKDGVPEFSVTAKEWEDIADDDRVERIYSGLSFSYYPEGAFHKIKVNGVVQAG